MVIRQYLYIGLEIKILDLLDRFTGGVRMKLTIFVLILLVAITGGMWGQYLSGLDILGAAQFTEVVSVDGIAEVKFPNQNWQPATVGMNIPLGGFIATSIGSSASLRMDDSIVSVQPLTNMEIRDLVKGQENVDSSLQLKFGRIRANVESTEGLAVAFEVQSTIATASVRGTDFEFGADGVLNVFESKVELQAAGSGAARVIPEGVQSYVDPKGAESAPRSFEEVAVEFSEVKPTAAPDVVENVIIADAVLDEIDEFTLEEIDLGAEVVGNPEAANFGVQGYQLQ